MADGVRRAQQTTYRIQRQGCQGSRFSGAIDPARALGQGVPVRRTGVVGFSSWLWPISVFDGIRNPDNSDINYYYPTNDLVTGPDIIFFWVARMIVSGYEFKNKEPFTSVYFTGLVRDKTGRKMSKQLGNSPDALKLIEDFGADSVSS